MLLVHATETRYVFHFIVAVCDGQVCQPRHKKQQVLWLSSRHVSILGRGECRTTRSRQHAARAAQHAEVEYTFELRRLAGSRWPPIPATGLRGTATWHCARRRDDEAGSGGIAAVGVMGVPYVCTVLVLLYYTL